MPSPWTRERRHLPATALLVLALVGSLLLTGCYGVDYRYLAVDRGGAPIAQRCGPMPFRINPHGAHSDWQLVAVVRAVQRLEAVTGVDWRFQGYTNERVASGFDPRAHGGRQPALQRRRAGAGALRGVGANGRPGHGESPGLRQ